MLRIMHHHEFSVMIHGNKNETEQCDISILWYLVEIIRVMTEFRLLPVLQRIRSLKKQISLL